jgi:hypothetical protein
LELRWIEQETTTEQVTDATGRASVKKTVESVQRTKTVDPLRSRLAVDLHLDQGRKGLLWFPLYDVPFAAKYQHADDVVRDLRLALTLPDKAGLYDDFRFVIDGIDLAPRLRPVEGVIATVLSVKPGQSVVLEVSHRSRGLKDAEAHRRASPSASSWL